MVANRNFARGPGRPRKNLADSVKPMIDLVKKDTPGLVSVIEKYLLQAQWTKEQLMAAIGVGETQLYRWGRGDSMPRKATVNRICVTLARRLDELHGDELHDPFPATDLIDAMLNELLQASGFSASVRGVSGDDCLTRIAKDNVWKLGYTEVPEWAIPPARKTGRPTGKAIDYAEKIGALMGLETDWTYFGFEDMPLAIRERKIDGIAPLMVVLPGRLFDYRFSAACGRSKFTLSALIPSEFRKQYEKIEDLPQKFVEILYVKGELGEWGCKMFESTYDSKSFSDSDKAIAYMKAMVENREKTIPVFLLDNITAHYLKNILSKERGLELSEIEVPIKLETHNAFAFHPDERKLSEAVDVAIKIFPLGKDIFSSIDKLI